MELTANQLYKIYKEDGGTLKFSNWLTREKTKGIFPINSDLNEEVYMAINGVKENEKKNKNRVLGFPLSTLYIMGGIIVGAIIVSKLIKKK
ncbi:MAG: hypothetical protein ACOVNU_09135 [Candidatus Kapaibacteriota bacterium]